MYRIHNMDSLPTAPPEWFDVKATLASTTVCSSHGPDSVPGAPLPAFCCRLDDHTGDHLAGIGLRNDGRVFVFAEWDDDRTTDGRLD